MKRVIGNANVSRRRFVGGAAVTAAGSALLAGGSTLAAEDAGTSVRRRPDCDVDVAIIGGGFAGVTAARDCRENGFSALLLEARGRLGGRTFTASFEGHDVELGGTWIHWAQPFVWAEKERYDLAVVETPGATPDRIVVHCEGENRELGEVEFGELIQAFQAVTADARVLLPQPFNPEINRARLIEADRMSVVDRLDQFEFTPLQRVCLESFFATCAHNNISDWSYAELLRWTALSGYNDFLLMLDSGARFKLKDGTSSMIDAMLEDGRPEVKLSTPVKAVEDLGDRVRITTTQGETIVAGAVICTVPMNVLPDLRFDPPLPRPVIEAGRTRHNGVGIKLFVKAKGRYGKLFAMADPGHPIGSLFTYDEGDDHTLFAGFGTDAQAMDFLDAKAVQDVLRLYLPDVEVESTFAYDWNLDPYSLGTWASYKTGWLESYAELFQQDSGRILFASGDHGDGWRGFIDGAIGAGSRAAERVRTVL